MNDENCSSAFREEYVSRFNDCIHVHSQRSRADNPRGQYLITPKGINL